MAELVKNYDNGSAIKIVYSYSQNVSKNQSTLTMSLYVHRDGYGPSWNTHCDSYLQVDGSSVMTYDGSFNIGTSWVKIGSTVSKTVTHNADGTKTVALKGFFDSQGLTTKLQNLKVSGNVTLKTIPRASSISSISGNTIGSPVTINISREVSSFTHKVYYTFGETKDYLLGSNVGTSLTFTPSMNDCNDIPNATKGTATIRVDTYNGSTKIGSVSKNFTLNVPASVAPTFTGIAFTPVDGEVPSGWGLYVKTKSKVTAAITGAAGAYGSTIKSYSISGGGYSGTSSSLTTGFLNTAGTITFTAKITDSRGRTAQKTASITVVDYAPPVLSGVAGFRCDSGGAEQDDGEYISLTASFSGASVEGKNTITGQYRYMPEGGGWSAFFPLSFGQAAVFPASGDATFVVQVQVSDAFTAVSQNVVVNSIRFIMDFRAGGNGIAFGKAAEYDNLLDCNWDAHFRKGLQADSDIYSSGMMVAGADIQIRTSASRSPSLLFHVADSKQDWTSHLYQPNATTLNVGIRNGNDTPYYLQWLGESGDGRHILRTNVNGTCYLGTTSYRWNTGFFTNTITQSDLKNKENIAGIPNAKEFIMALKPIAYTLKDGDSGRIHMGFGAQEVAKAAAEHEMGDLALYQAAVIGENGEESYFRSDVPDESLSWGLNYHEFLAPLIALVQEQENRIQQLENRLADTSL